MILDDEGQPLQTEEEAAQDYLDWMESEDFDRGYYEGENGNDD